MEPSGGAEFAVRFTRAGTRPADTAPVGSFHGTVEVDGLYRLFNLETASSHTVWVQCPGGLIRCSSNSRRKTLSTATTAIALRCVQVTFEFPGKGALDSAVRMHSARACNLAGQVTPAQDVGYMERPGCPIPCCRLSRELPLPKTHAIPLGHLALVPSHGAGCSRMRPHRCLCSAWSAARTPVRVHRAHPLPHDP